MSSYQPSLDIRESIKKIRHTQTRGKREEGKNKDPANTKKGNHMEFFLDNYQRKK